MILALLEARGLAVESKIQLGPDRGPQLGRVKRMSRSLDTKRQLCVAAGTRTTVELR